MKKRRIFNSEKVGALMSTYRRHKKDTALRDRIINLTLPLIDAAITRKIKSYRNREDLRKDLKQECVVKLLYALPKFDPSRGNAFAFLWTMICNTCTTQGQRLSSHNLSLSSDEDIQKEAESNGHSVFETPENRHILNSIADSLDNAFESIRVPNRRLHRKACRKIREFLVSGELFYNKHYVMRRMKRLGLDRKEIQFYIDRTLVLVRQELLEARENSRALTVQEVGPIISKNSSSGIL
jgi:DNA-directed RNA polymerase specialized sigma24 family protein